VIRIIAQARKRQRDDLAVIAHPQFDGLIIRRRGYRVPMCEMKMVGDVHMRPVIGPYRRRFAFHGSGGGT